MCEMGGIFVQGHLPIMYNVYLPVFLVTLLIIVGPYETYILTYLSHVHMKYFPFVANM